MLPMTGRRAPIMNTRLAYIARTKLKVLAWLLGITLATIGSVSLAGLPLLPMLGVAVAAVAVSISKATGRLGKPTCYHCGTDLSDEPVGTHGVVCTHCGSIHMRQPAEDPSHDAEA